MPVQLLITKSFSELNEHNSYVTMQTGNTRLILDLTLQAEETKVLRLQLELSQAKGDTERRLQEKEEELEAARCTFNCYRITMGLLTHKIFHNIVCLTVIFLISSFIFFTKVLSRVSYSLL